MKIFKSFRQKSLLILGTLVLAAWSGCITVEENYTFKPNGSGTMEYRLDMSELSGLMGMAGEEGGGTQDLMGDDASFKELGDKLEGIQGISKIKVNEDNENYIYSLTFKFKNLNSLNAALNKIITDDSGGENHTFFKMEDGKIIRTHYMNENIPMDDLMGDDEDSEMAMGMLESMKYRVNMTFKKPVKAVYSAGEVMMTDGDKKITLESNFKDLTEGGVEKMNATVVLN
jgi:hypothetical protein